MKNPPEDEVFVPLGWIGAHLSCPGGAIYYDKDKDKFYCGACQKHIKQNQGSWDEDEQ